MSNCPTLRVNVSTTQYTVTYPAHLEVVGVGVEVVHPRIPKIAQEVVGVALKVGVEDAVDVGLQPRPRGSLHVVVGKADEDWLA